MSEGFEHRLKANIQSAPDFDTLMSLVKTKRFTYAYSTCIDAIIVEHKERCVQRGY